MSEQITCTRCGHKMSSHVKTCPYCGAFLAETVNEIVQNTTEQITCIRCGHKMSSHVKTCPYCGAFATGTINGIAMNTAKVYGKEKFHGKQWHGHADERANAHYDRMTGKDARIVGDDKYDAVKEMQNRIAKGQVRLWRDHFFKNVVNKGAGIKYMQNQMNKGQFRGIKNA